MSPAALAVRTSAIIMHLRPAFKQNLQGLMSLLLRVHAKSLSCADLKQCGLK
jgi:hypothetical protein